MKTYTKPDASEKPSHCGCYLIIALALLIGGAFWLASETHALRDCAILSHASESSK